MTTKRRVRKSKRSTSRRKSTNKRNNSRRNNSRRNNSRRKNIRRKSTNKRQGKVIQDGGARQDKAEKAAEIAAEIAAADARHTAQLEYDKRAENRRIRREKRTRVKAIELLRQKEVSFRPGWIRYSSEGSKTFNYKESFNMFCEMDGEGDFNDCDESSGEKQLDIDRLINKFQRRDRHGTLVMVNKTPEIVGAIENTYAGNDGMNLEIFTNLLSKLNVGFPIKKQGEKGKDLMPWRTYSDDMPSDADVWGAFTQSNWDDKELMDKKRWAYLMVERWSEAEKKGVETKEIWWEMVNNEGSRSALELLGLVKETEEDFVQRFRSGRVPDEYAYPKLYGILGVENNANRKVIRKAWVKLATEHHPDKGGDPSIYQNIQKAWDVLGDDDNRKLYNQGRWGEMWGGNRRVRKF
jgi:hypothetical protein